MSLCERYTPIGKPGWLECERCGHAWMPAADPEPNWRPAECYDKRTRFPWEESTQELPAFKMVTENEALQLPPYAPMLFMAGVVAGFALGFLVSYATLRGVVAP